MKRRKTIQFIGLSFPALSSLPFLFSGCEEILVDHSSESTLFKRQEWNTLNKIVDLIIPESETPSATQVKVPHRIEELLVNNYSSKMISNFNDGLIFYEAQSKFKFNKKTVDCNSQELRIIMDEIISNTQTGNAKDTYPFYPLLKGLTVSAFFTSKDMHKYFQQKKKSMLLR